MLIELEFEIKLPVIVFFILHEGMFEKFVDVILDKQRVSKDSHDLNNWATNLMVMFNDTNKTVCDDSNMGSSEDRETEVDGCRVDSIESLMKFKLLGDSSLLRLADHIEGKIFINSVITESIGLGDDTSVGSSCSETEIIRTFGMSLDYVNEFPKTGTARKLRKYKHTKMVPMSKTPFLCPVVVSADNTIELTFKPVGYLVEDIVSNMHNCSNLKLGTKVRISKVGHYFQELLCCA